MKERFDINNNSKISIIALISALGVLSIANDSESTNSIPYCDDLNNHHVPQTPPFLHGKEAEGNVVCIVDGDTFDVKLDDGKLVRARLWGVDCPESSKNEKCMKNGSSECNEEVQKGKSASNSVRKILSNNKRVTLEPPYKNNGNRLLSYIRLQNGVDLGRQLVKSCLCESGYKHKRNQDYQSASRQCK